MRRLSQLLLFYLMLLWLGSMLLAGNAACLPLIGLPRPWRERFLQWLISRIFRVFLAGCQRCGLMQLDLTALDQIDHQSGMVLAANHPSMIDVFLVVSRVSRAVCLMKSSLMGNVLLAPGAFLAGYIPNQHPEYLLKCAVAAVQRGQMLLIFPEGTRTVTSCINSLKPGAAMIARLARAPVQLVILETNSPYLAKGWPIWRPPAFPLRYRARLGPTLDASQPVPETMANMCQGFERAMPDGPFHFQENNK